MTTHRVFRLSLACCSLVACVANAVAQLPELRDLDLSGWDCLSKLEGIAKTQDGKERNQQKNRSSIEFTGSDIKSFDTAAFLARVADYDRQIEKKHRRDLSPTQEEQLIALEKQIVSITGWLVLAYQGIPETTNCRSQDFLDWHLELSPESADQPAQVGDPTPVICEITPRTVGSSIGWFSKEGYHHPWRTTGWEIPSGAKNRRSRDRVIAPLDSLGRLDYECATRRTWTRQNFTFSFSAG